MKTIPVLSLAALLFASISAPAQIRIEGRFGRLQIGCGPVVAPPVRHCPPVPHCEPVQHCPPPPVRRHGRQHGYWETRCERVLVSSGYWREECVPPTYGWVRSPCGGRHWGVVDPGGHRSVWVPEVWETRTVRVWLPC
jgi:hypothetical protein